MKTKHEVLQAHLKEWLACSNNKFKRGEVTKSLAKSTKMHPKSIGRAMRTLQLKKKSGSGSTRGRKKYYDKSVGTALYEIWTCMDHPCAEAMHPEIPEYIASYIHNDEWIHDDIATGKLRAMSLGTLKNRLRDLRTKENKTRGYSATKPSKLKMLIPVRKSHEWHTLPPGYTQMDTVVHCGDLLTDDVIYSLGIIDVATYWSEYAAQWNKGMVATKESIARLVTRFPFKILELHPDTGSEFINHFVYDWAMHNNIAMTRSEAYKKNDNMCIEERNDDIPRKHLGYIRLDDSSFVSLADEILATACLIHNHFRANRRMASKERHGAKWKRTFEKNGMSPYNRVLRHKDISEENKQKLRAEHTKLDPLSLQRKLATLKQELYQKISKKQSGDGNSN